MTTEVVLTYISKFSNVKAMIATQILPIGVLISLASIQLQQRNNGNDSIFLPPETSPHIFAFDTADAKAILLIGSGAVFGCCEQQ